MPDLMNVSDILANALRDLDATFAVPPLPSAFDPAPWADLAVEPDAVAPAVPPIVVEAVSPAATEPDQPRRRRGGRARYAGGRNYSADWRQVAVTTVEVDEVRRRINLFFASKPPEELRARMKAQGWRFDGRTGGWFHADNAANRSLATSYCVAHAK